MRTLSHGDTDFNRIFETSGARDSLGKFQYIGNTDPLVYICSQPGISQSFTYGITRDL